MMQAMQQQQQQHMFPSLMAMQAQMNAHAMMFPFGMQFPFAYNMQQQPAPQHQQQQFVASTSGDAAGTSKEAVLSPSFAAIQARIAFQSKREKDLQDAQALHEYYVAKFGLPK
eukprot:4721566-Pleurochrysis_carterae.AAC.1